MEGEGSPGQQADTIKQPVIEPDQKDDTREEQEPVIEADDKELEGDDEDETGNETTGPAEVDEEENKNKTEPEESAQLPPTTEPDIITDEPPADAGETKPAKKLKTPERVLTIDDVKKDEIGFLTRKIILTKYSEISPNENPNAWNSSVTQYAIIANVETEPDGALKYYNKHTGETHVGLIPLDFGYKPRVILKDGNYLAATKDDEGAIEIAQINEKNGTEVTCTDVNGTSHVLEIGILANAQLQNVVEGNAKVPSSMFNNSEKKIIDAYHYFALNQDKDLKDVNPQSKIDALYEDKDISIEEIAQLNGCMDAQSTVDAFLLQAYPDIKPSNGIKRDPEEEKQQTFNERAREKIKNDFKVGDRKVLTNRVLAGVLNATAKDANFGENIDDVLKNVMQNMDPKLAETMTGLVKKGNVEEIYKKFLEEYADDPTAMERLGQFYEKYGKLIASVGGIAAAFMLIMVARGYFGAKS